MWATEVDDIEGQPMNRELSLHTTRLTIPKASIQARLASVHHYFRLLRKDRWAQERDRENSDNVRVKEWPWVVLASIKLESVWLVSENKKGSYLPC